MSREEAKATLLSGLVSDLNFEDSEVGISAFDNLEEFVEYNGEEYSGVEFTEVSLHKATVTLEGYDFVIKLGTLNEGDPLFQTQGWVVE